MQYTKVELENLQIGTIVRVKGFYEEIFTLIERKTSKAGHTKLRFTYTNTFSPTIGHKNVVINNSFSADGTQTNRSSGSSYHRTFHKFPSFDSLN